MTKSSSFRIGSRLSYIVGLNTGQVRPLDGFLCVMTHTTRLHAKVCGYISTETGDRSLSDLVAARVSAICTRVQFR